MIGHAIAEAENFDPAFSAGLLGFAGDTVEE
jgi:hypothetical protein